MTGRASYRERRGCKPIEPVVRPVSARPDCYAILAADIRRHKARCEAAVKRIDAFLADPVGIDRTLVREKL